MRQIIEPYSIIYSNGNVASFYFKGFLETVGMLGILTFSATFMRDFSLQAFLFENVLYPISFGEFAGFAFLWISQSQLAFANVNF